MTDDAELAAIRASIERDADRPFVHYAQWGARTLLRRLDSEKRVVATHHKWISDANDAINRLKGERDALAARNAELEAAVRLGFHCPNCHCERCGNTFQIPAENIRDLRR